jgi:hypothetical protein
MDKKRENSDQYSRRDVLGFSALRKLAKESKQTEISQQLPSKTEAKKLKNSFSRRLFLKYTVLTALVSKVVDIPGLIQMLEKKEVLPAPENFGAYIDTDLIKDDPNKLISLLMGQDVYLQGKAKVDEFAHHQASDREMYMDDLTAQVKIIPEMAINLLRTHGVFSLTCSNRILNALGVTELNWLKVKKLRVLEGIQKSDYQFTRDQFGNPESSAFIHAEPIIEQLKQTSQDMIGLLPVGEYKVAELLNVERKLNIAEFDPSSPQFDNIPDVTMDLEYYFVLPFVPDDSMLTFTEKWDSQLKRPYAEYRDLDTQELKRTEGLTKDELEERKKNNHEVKPVDQEQTLVFEPFHPLLAEANLRELFKICSAFDGKAGRPYKLLFVPGGTFGSNMAEARKKLEDEGIWPDNLIITGGLNGQHNVDSALNQNRKPDTMAGGADVFILREEGLDPTNDLKKTFLSDPDSSHRLSSSEANGDFLGLAISLRMKGIPADQVKSFIFDKLTVPVEYIAYENYEAYQGKKINLKKLAAVDTFIENFLLLHTAVKV